MVVVTVVMLLVMAMQVVVMVVVVELCQMVGEVHKAQVWRGAGIAARGGWRRGKASAAPAHLGRGGGGGGGCGGFPWQCVGGQHQPRVLFHMTVILSLL